MTAHPTGGAVVTDQTLPPQRTTRFVGDLRSPL
jgi:hypothetical protein